MAKTMTTPAHKLISQGRVKVTGYGNDRVFWEVGIGKNKVKITERRERFGEFYDCTCKSCSIAGENAGICVFKKSVIAYKVLGVKQNAKEKEKV